MKWLLSLTAILFCLAADAQLTITNHFGMSFYWDSFGTAQFAQRYTFVVWSFYAQMYPQYVMSPRDRSRSGADNIDVNTNRLQKLGSLDAALCTGVTNWFNFLFVSGNHVIANGGSNGIFAAQSQSVQAPTNTYNRLDVFTNDPPIPNAPLHFRNVLLGDIAYWPGGNGGVVSTASRDYSYGGRSVALANGWPFVDMFVNISNAVQTAYGINTNGFWFSSSTGSTNDHWGNEIQFVGGLTTIKSLGEDTNIFTAVMDWSNPSVPSQTNHCTVSGGSVVGNTFTFTLHADRMGSSYYVPSATQTNDMTGGIPLMPSLTNYQCEMLRVTNLPALNYNMFEDGVQIMTNVASSTLSAGINLFLVNAGAMWNQKCQTMNLLCYYANVSPTNATDTYQPHGTNELWVAQGSYAATVWPTNSTSVTNYIAQSDMVARNNALLAEDQVLNANVQQTNHTFVISAIATRYVNARIR